MCDMLQLVADSPNHSSHDVGASLRTLNASHLNDKLKHVVHLRAAVLSQWCGRITAVSKDLTSHREAITLGAPP